MSDGGSAIAPIGESFRSTATAIMRRNKLWLGLGASPWAIGMALIVGAITTHHYALLAGLGHALMFGGLGFALAYKFDKGPSWDPVELTADGRGVAIGNEIVATRDEIQAGFVLPYRGKTCVRLKRRRRPSLYIAVPGVEEGRRLLKALGLDATQSVARVNALSPVFSLSGGAQFGIFMTPAFAVFAGVMTTAALGARGGTMIGALFLPLAVATLLMITLTRTKVHVGADGILTRWLGRERFYAFKDIEWVNPLSRSTMNKTYIGVELVLRNGEHAQIFTGQKRFGEEEQDALLERIREAVDAFKTGSASTDASVLARNGLAPRDWVTALRRVGAGANADMRTASIPLERLWRIVEDAGALPLARVGAAIAIAPQVPPSERRRIRVAAETTAAPRLRVALEHASSPDTSDEELAEELAHLEAEV